MESTGIKLSRMIPPSAVVDLPSCNKAEALLTLCQRLENDPRVLDCQAFYNALVERERQASTGVGLGIAIPHVKIPQLTDYIVAVGRVRDGMDFDAEDGKPVNLIFLVGASDRQTREFIKLLVQITHLLKSDHVRQALLEAPTTAAVYQLICDHER